MITGRPGSVWITAPSCTLLPAPTWIQSLSPRSTALNHTLLSSPSRTEPMTSALGAT
jgi:hypothetical protein